MVCGGFPPAVRQGGGPSEFQPVVPASPPLQTHDHPNKPLPRLNALPEKPSLLALSTIPSTTPASAGECPDQARQTVRPSAKCAAQGSASPPAPLAAAFRPTVQM